MNKAMTLIRKLGYIVYRNRSVLARIARSIYAAYKNYKGKAIK